MTKEKLDEIYELFDDITDDAAKGMTATTADEIQNLQQSILVACNQIQQLLP